MQAIAEGVRHMQWRMAVARCEEMIERSENIITEHAETWNDGMVRHWTERLEQLAKREPPYGE